MPKTIAICIILIIGLFILYTLVKQIFLAMESGNRLTNMVSEVASLQSKNQQLQHQISETQKYGFIENIARNSLNYAKPGETMVIISDGAIDQVLGVQKKVEIVKIPNWQGWLRLFGF